MDTLRAQIAAITALVARTVGNAEDGVRFCVVASRPGLSVGHVCENVARVMDMYRVSFRMSGFDAESLASDEPESDGRNVRGALRWADTPLVVLGDCEAANPGALRAMVERLSGLTRDDKGASRMMVVVLDTKGDAATCIQAVREATGRGPVGFLVLDDVAPVLEAA